MTTTSHLITTGSHVSDAGYYSGTVTTITTNAIGQPVANITLDEGGEHMQVVGLLTWTGGARNAETPAVEQSDDSDDEPSTPAVVLALPKPQDHLRPQPRVRSGKTGRFNSPARRADVLNRLAARVNAHVITAASYLRDLGADDDTVRRYASQLGKRAKALAATKGVQPTLTGLAVVGRHLVRCLAYSQSDAEILRQAVADYPKTSHLIQIGA